MYAVEYDTGTAMFTTQETESYAEAVAWWTVYQKAVMAGQLVYCALVEFDSDGTRIATYHSPEPRSDHHSVDGLDA